MEEGDAHRQAGRERTQMEMQQRWREHDEEMRQRQEELRLVRLQNSQRRENKRGEEARRQLQESEARFAEQMRQMDDELARRERLDWTGVLLGAASIGATLMLASPLLFPQVGQGKEGEEEEKKAASWSGKIQVENEDGKYVRMNLPEFVAALFTHDIRMFRDYPPDQSKRFRALLAELSSFVGSDRDIRESKHFRQFNAGDIRTIRETWPEIVRLQAPLLLGGAVSVREFAETVYDEDSPWGRFHRAIGIIIQGAGQIMADPVRPMTMTGGSVAT